ncbi:hypothetical protein [Pedobacter steynii]
MKDLITPLIILGICGLIGLVAYYITRNQKRKRYDNENSRAIIEEVRNSFEKQLYSINDRLIKSEERWKDVNHLLIGNNNSVESIPQSKRKVYYSDFLKSNGIRENDLLIDEKLVFVLTPFHDRFAQDYEVIKETCLKAGLRCVRGDETYFKGDIFPEMLKLIVKSKLIIANINGRNPNVMYELGVAQALDKSVLLLSGQPENLPIDIKSKRFLIYKTLPDLQEMLRRELLELTGVRFS